MAPDKINQVGRAIYCTEKDLAWAKYKIHSWAKRAERFFENKTGNKFESEFFLTQPHEFSKPFCYAGKISVAH